MVVKIIDCIWRFKRAGVKQLKPMYKAFLTTLSCCVCVFASHIFSRIDYCNPQAVGRKEAKCCDYLSQAFGTDQQANAGDRIYTMKSGEGARI
ncbi:hypothetical protein [Salinimonas sediminis]|uniref:Uncharacterized protein n=1 Tax=Salinimonas sediminis TaxID=2303538 RepID=A0A346NP67_9ALTE|nr:hypothetical protein [Salinimonas sediminis]AXR07324.1 hypothetical protein D0Y50_13800 [Salinimonas sediminis]